MKHLIKLSISKTGKLLAGLASWVHLLLVAVRIRNESSSCQARHMYDNMENVCA